MIEHHPIPLGHRLHPMRSQYLTASDVPAAAGLNPFKSRLRLFLEKAGQIDNVADNDMMQRGRWLESAAIEAMKEQHPEFKIVQPGVFVCDPETRLGATPDAWIKEDDGRIVNLQIKSSRPAQIEEWNGRPPLYYELQVVAEGMLLDAASSILCAFSVDSFSARLHLYHVPRHPAAEARIRQIAADFWRDVEAGKMPPPDYARDAGLIEKLFPPRPDIATTDLSGDNRLAKAIERRWKRKAYMKRAEDWVKSVDAEIIHKLAGAQRGVLPGWRISHKMQHRAGYTVAARDAAMLKIAREREG